MNYLFDGINHPTAAEVRAAGAIGALVYVGTPGSGKDVTAAQYADYKADGLLVLNAYEHLATDISGGSIDGATHAWALVQDATAKGVSFSDPALAVVDEHVTAADIPLAMQYQAGFRNGLRRAGWRGPIGIYGFSEILIAAHDAGLADFYMGCGSQSSMPPYTNIWQDNTGTIQVGGSTDDRDWIRIPLTIPAGDTQNALADYARTESLHQMLPAVNWPQAPTGVQGERNALAAAINQILANQAAISGALSQLQRQIAALTPNPALKASGTAQVTVTLTPSA